MADPGDAMNPLPLVLIGVAGYLLLKGMGTPAAVTAPGPAAPTMVPTKPTAPSADSIRTKMIAAMTAGQVPQSGGDFTGTPWGFNWWLNQVAGIQIPDMGAAFPGCGTGVQGGCDTTQISFTQFWSQAAPFLQKQGSLSGIGCFPVQCAGVRTRVPVTLPKGWR